MKVEKLAIPDVLLLTQRVFGDDRGYFFETFSERSFQATGLSERFVQDNVSFSRRGILRGLHLQNPNGQGKLVMALTGRVFDVAVDLRVGSPHFGEWVGAELSEDNHQQLYIPPGFGHGFCVLSETAHFAYKCTAFYDPSSEMSVRYDDPVIGIDWPIEEPLLSPKDAAAPRLEELVASGRLPTFRS